MRLRGYIFDDAGAPISGAAVEAYGSEGDLPVRETVSLANGFWSLMTLPADEYRIKILYGKSVRWLMPDEYIQIGAVYDLTGQSITDETGDAVPLGGILMWYGSESTVPTGWAICDGTNGTPDLQECFLLGAGDEYLVGDTGGEAEVVLSIDEMPAHTHTCSSTGSHRHTLTTRPVGQGDVGGRRFLDGAGQQPHSTSTIGSHSHLISGAGGSRAHENRPPYKAVLYIMRVI